MRLHLDGDYIPIFPIGFFGFSYQAAAQKRFSPILTFFKSNSTLFFLILGYIVVMWCQTSVSRVTLEQNKKRVILVGRLIWWGPWFPDIDLSVSFNTT